MFTPRQYLPSLTAVALSLAMVGIAASVQAQTPAGQTSSDTVISVDRHASMWALARPITPKGTTTQQVMIAILRINPDAFEGGNLNRLRLGSKIRIPSEDSIRAENAKQAASIYFEHEQAWQRNTSVKPLAPAVAKPAETGSPAPATAPAAAQQSAASAPRPVGTDSTAPASTATPAPATPAAGSQSEATATASTAKTDPVKAVTDTASNGPSESAPAGRGWQGLAWFGLALLVLAGSWLALRPKRSAKTGRHDHAIIDDLDALGIELPPSHAAAFADAAPASSTPEPVQKSAHQPAAEVVADAVVVPVTAQIEAKGEPNPSEASNLGQEAPRADVLAFEAKVTTDTEVERPPFDVESLRKPFLPQHDGLAAPVDENAPSEQAVAQQTTRIVARGDTQVQEPNRPEDEAIVQALVHAYVEIGRPQQAQDITQAFEQKS